MDRAQVSDEHARIFRDCVGEFATGVAVVIAEHPDGPAGMTINAFTSVSLDPLLILVSLAHGSRTLAAVHAGERFSVSILRRDQRDIAIDFATPGGTFHGRHVTRDASGSFIITDAAAALTCERTDLVRSGDHDVVLARVIGIAHRGGEPLVFHRGRFGGMDADAVVPPDHPIGIGEGGGW